MPLGSFQGNFWKKRWLLCSSSVGPAPFPIKSLQRLLLSEGPLKRGAALTQTHNCLSATFAAISAVAGRWIDFAIQVAISSLAPLLKGGLKPQQRHPRLHFCTTKTWTNDSHQCAFVSMEKSTDFQMADTPCLAQGAVTDDKRSFHEQLWKRLNAPRLWLLMQLERRARPTAVRGGGAAPQQTPKKLSSDIDLVYTFSATFYPSLGTIFAKLLYFEQCFCNKLFQMLLQDHY